MPETSEKKYILVANDGHEFPISEKIAAMSEVLKKMLSHCVDSGRVPIPDLDSRILKLVVDFCKYHENDPVYVPPKAGDPKNVVPDEGSWDMKFLYVVHEDLLDVVNAASYLDIPRLIDACVYRMQLMIQGRSTEEIRTAFKIANDFTKAEEEQLKTEHIWYDCPIPPNPKFSRNQ